MALTNEPIQETINYEKEPIIKARDVQKWYGSFHALKGITLDVFKGEVIVIFGPSGSGKSSFIRCINHLEEHDEGQIIVDGIELNKNMHNIEQVRMETGMVFQQFNLFPHMTVMQNITLAPVQVRKWSKEKAEEIGMQLLERVGIPEQAYKYPLQLSGGQQQRVAIARALVAEPVLILADEPTGNLDTHASDEIAALLRQVADDWGRSVVMVTHDPRIAAYADRIVFLKDGVIVDETPLNGKHIMPAAVTGEKVAMK